MKVQDKSGSSQSNTGASSYEKESEMNFESRDVGASWAAQADISREVLYRSLSPKGNPTLKTLLAVLKTVGLRLSCDLATSVRERSQ